MHLFRQLLSHAEKVANVIGGIAVIMIAIITLAGVAERFLGISSTGIYESVELLLVAVVFLPLSFGQSNKSHIHVDLVVERLHGPMRNILDIFILLVSLVIFSLITWRSGISALQAWKTGDVIMGVVNYPLWPSKILVPIGCGLMSIRLLVQLLGQSLGGWNQKPVVKSIEAEKVS